jgi:hypothetical protein
MVAFPLLLEAPGEAKKKKKKVWELIYTCPHQRFYLISNSEAEPPIIDHLQFEVFLDGFRHGLLLWGFCSQ